MQRKRLSRELNIVRILRGKREEDDYLYGSCGDGRLTALALTLYL
jgi:hypothetical protein